MSADAARVENRSSAFVHGAFARASFVAARRDEVLGGRLVRGSLRATRDAAAQRAVDEEVDRRAVVVTSASVLESHVLGVTRHIEGGFDDCGIDGRGFDGCGAGIDRPAFAGAADDEH